MFEVVLRRHRRRVGVRMIKPDNLEIATPRVLLTAHQLFRRNQEPVALRTLLARIRNRIRLANNLSIVAEAPQQQPATLVWIIAHAVFANLRQLFFRDFDHKACSMSAIMSSILSMPTEMRTRPSLIPNSARLAGVMSR